MRRPHVLSVLTILLIIPSGAISAQKEATPRLSIGLASGPSMAWFSGTMGLPVVTRSSDTFGGWMDAEGVKGWGYSLGMHIIVPLGQNWGLQADVLYSSLQGVGTIREDGWLTIVGGPYPPEVRRTDISVHAIDLGIGYWSVPVDLGVASIRLSTVPVASFALGTHGRLTYESTDSIPYNPRGVPVEDHGRRHVYFDGELRELSRVWLSLAAGLSMDLHLGSSWLLNLATRYQYPMSAVASEMRVAVLQLSIGISLDLGSQDHVESKMIERL